MDSPAAVAACNQENQSILLSTKLPIAQRKQWLLNGGEEGNFFFPASDNVEGMHTDALSNMNDCDAQ